MKELKCPNCGSAFTVDEAGYASILQQVKTAEFDGEVQRRLAEIRKSDEQARALELEKQRLAAQAALDATVREIADLQARIGRNAAEANAKLADKAMEERQAFEMMADLWRTTLAEKDAEIANLKADYTAKLKIAEARAEQGIV